MRYFVVFLFFFFLGVITSWPLILHINDFILNLQDGLLLTWYLNWSIAHPLNLNANIFYPFKNTLAFSDMMLPQALLTAIPVKLFSSPLLAYNLNFLLGLVLTGFTLFLLLDYLKVETKLAIACGVIFNFSSVHLSYAVHLQLFNFWPVILATLFLLQKNRSLFILFFIISSLTTSLFFYFLVVLCFFIKPRYWVIKNGVIAVLFTIPFLTPYFFVSWQWHYVRPITDAINGSIAPTDLLNQFFPGFGFIFLIILAIKSKNKINKYFFWIFLISLILSFGPALHLVKETVHIGRNIIPLPYALLYYLVPGFSGFRTPSRWMILGFFALVVYLAQKIRSIRWFWFLVLITLTFASFKPFVYYKVPPVPSQNYYLAKHYPNVPVIYFPIYGWFDLTGVYNETERMYFSTVNWNPMFNGYSGFSPKIWEEKVKWLQQNYPSQETKDYLRSIGVKLVIENDKIYVLD